MPLPKPLDEPLLTDGEREELASLDDFVDRLKALASRGLIAPDALEVVVSESRQRALAIHRDGRFQAALAQARALATKDPTSALECAEGARELDPSRPEAWELCVSLLWELEEDERSIALCTEAVERFPHFRETLDEQKSEQAARALARHARADRIREDQRVEDTLALARSALADHRDAEAIAGCREILGVRPDHLGALAVAAYAHERSGQLEDALALYERLVALRPSNVVWSQWVRNIRLRQGIARLTGKAPAVAASPGPLGDPAAMMARAGIAGPPPHFSWPGFAGEFLLEHWQKLILCLAVLLIVVSSTVGAHVLLGPLLWSPAGKAALAMVATLMFAALGAGLLRWGAQRAGRMMLVATLIVVPIHFMLAGELKLLVEPSVSRLAFLIVDGLALVALVGLVARMLVPRAEAAFLTASLLLLSAGSAVTAQASPLDWSWQFAAFQAPGIVFLGAVCLLGARRWGASSALHRGFSILLLALLGFAFLACLIRTGAYALRLEPALYAVPVMLGAMACVLAARQLAPHEPDLEHLALFRFGGYVLSGLAFALALAQAPSSSNLESANTLVVGLLGFALYTASLRSRRHPAFLYLAIGALLVARIGAHPFLIERIRLVIDVIRRLLGYPVFLPWPFLSVLGLVASPALALLSVWFVRHWNDRRLAMHCHYLGVPLSVAAGTYSTFEPLAATICLAGYSVLYSLATWIFAAPWVTYLAMAAAGGAVYFGSTLVAGVTAADQALLAAALGWLCGIVRRLLQMATASEAYLVPWSRGARAFSALAMVVATLWIATRGPYSLGAAGVFLLVAILAVLSNNQRPKTAWASLALVSLVELSICSLSLLTGGRAHPPVDFGVLFSACALAMLAAAELLRIRQRTASPGLVSGAVRTDRPLAPRPADTFIATLPTFAICLVFIADWLALEDVRLAWTSGLVWLLCGPVLLGATRFFRHRSLVYLGLAQLVAGALDLLYWPFTWSDPGLAMGWLAVVAAVIAFCLWMAAIVSRRWGLSDFYVEPCLHGSLALTAAVLGLALESRVMVRSAYRFGLVALVLNAAVTMLLARAWRKAALTYVAVFHVAVATYLVLFSVGRNDPAMAYVLGCSAILEAIGAWWLGFACQRWGGRWAQSCAPPLYNAAVALTFLGIPLADRSPVTLALAALSFLLTVKSMRRAEWLYATVAALGAACYFRWLAAWSPSEVMAFATGAAFVLWGTGLWLARVKPALCARLELPALDYEYPLFHSSIAAGLLALGLRVAMTVSAGVSWSAHRWFPLTLAVLALLMLRAYPRRLCVHASLALLAWGAFALISPSLSSVGALCLAGMVVALGFLLLHDVARAVAPAACRAAGVVEAGYASVVGAWASALFGVAAIYTTGVVLAGMAHAICGWEPGRLVASTAGWWAVLAALATAAAFVTIAAAHPGDVPSIEPDLALLALAGIGVLAVWWLGVVSSPLLVRAVPPADYYPVVTALAALATAHLGRRFAYAETWDELVWLGEIRSERGSRAMSLQACCLAMLAAVLTFAAIVPSTVVALTLASIPLALGALALGSPLLAGAGSLCWAGAWFIGGLVIARRAGISHAESREIIAALGASVGAWTHWALAGALRAGGPALSGRIGLATSLSSTLHQRLAVVLEGTASVTALVATVVALAAGSRDLAPASWATWTGVGVILAAAVLHIALFPRWKSEWLAYLAQGLMVAAYVDFRFAYPLPTAGDAAILTLLGYLDLGIAEVLQRLPAAPLARPARHFSLVLPLLPLFQLLWTGWREDVSLFYLATAATFYSIARAQLRWKSLGYAAAVFCNAALWVTWSRLGWMLADHPQFFLVPVGLSAILFAEVNRELGRPTVNAIRSVGLIVIYVSLAVPIWRFESFGAWLALLFGSLLGIIVGIGLRLQTFVWLGLATFVLDVVYEMGRMSVDYALAKWAIMLTLGILLVLFVALNEKKRVVGAIRDYYGQVRLWE
jgi:tetratricopeptide (TPR) repeat protein